MHEPPSVLQHESVDTASQKLLCLGAFLSLKVTNVPIPTIFSFREGKLKKLGQCKFALTQIKQLLNCSSTREFRYLIQSLCLWFQSCDSAFELVIFFFQLLNPVSTTKTLQEMPLQECRHANQHALKKPFHLHLIEIANKKVFLILAFFIMSYWVPFVWFRAKKLLHWPSDSYAPNNRYLKTIK